MTGIEGLTGVMTEIPAFWTAFFFSCQTFTTLGYGGIHPTTLGTNIVASFEAFVGIFSVALATGLLYGRFSKPKARIAFSDKLLISKINDEPSILFKIVNLRHNVLLRTKVSCILILDKGVTDQSYNKTYHQLKLETDYVLFFPLTWTLVHKLDHSSPLYDLSLESIVKRNGELVIFLETFDETFGVEIIQKHSYAGEQWAENLKFDMNFNSNSEGKIDLHIRSLNKTIPL
jgi:inward rectifier potassium channel